MKPAKLPALVIAHLRVAFKLPLHKRQEAIDKIIRQTKLFYPQCFIDTIGNKPFHREPTSYEKYIDTLKTQKETTK